MVTGAATAGIGMIVFAAVAFTVVLGAALFALRQREPRSTGGWFATRVTWLSGGRG